MWHVGLVTEDGKKLMLDYPDQFKAEYAHFAGYEVEVEIRKKRTKRSLKQNAFLHAAIKPFADHCGYTVEELKLALLGECFGYHQVNGVTLPVKLHTADLSTQEFCDITELLMQKAAEENILILAPDEFRREKKKQLRRGTGSASRGLAPVVGVPEGEKPSVASMDGSGNSA
jgi:hypothetical protein